MRHIMAGLLLIVALGVMIEVDAQAIEDCEKLNEVVAAKLVDQLLESGALANNLTEAQKKDFKRLFKLPKAGNVCFQAGASSFACQAPRQRDNCCKLKEFGATVEDQIKKFELDLELGKPPAAVVLHAKVELKGKLGPIDESRNRCNVECCNGHAEAALYVEVKVNITAAGLVWIPGASGIDIEADLALKKPAVLGCGDRARRCAKS